MISVGRPLEGEEPTVLLVAHGERLAPALQRHLADHGMFVEIATPRDVAGVAFAAAPDLIVLAGEAASDGGHAILERLNQNPMTSALPVLLISGDGASDLGSEFRHGVVAVLDRSASADEMARRIAEVAYDLPERTGEARGRIDANNLEDVLALVGDSLRSGILALRNEQSGHASQVVVHGTKPVEKVVAEIVEKLRPLVASSTDGALSYVFHESPASRFSSVDLGHEQEAAIAHLRGRSVLVVEQNAARADLLTQDLRAVGARVVVVDASGEGLDIARENHPDVVLVDGSGMEGWALTVFRAIRRDTALRWASVLVVEADRLWRDPRRPDLGLLAASIEGLMRPDHELRDRGGEHDAVDTRLETIGPVRTLRALLDAGKPLRAHIRDARLVVDIDVTDGLIACARARSGDKQAEGPSALATFLALSSGKVRVTTIEAPRAADIMAPLDAALGAASRERGFVRPSSRPPPARSSQDIPALPRAPDARKFVDRLDELTADLERDGNVDAVEESVTGAMTHEAMQRLKARMRRAADEAAAAVPKPAAPAPPPPPARPKLDLKPLPKPVPKPKATHTERPTRASVPPAARSSTHTERASVSPAARRGTEGSPPKAGSKRRREPTLLLGSPMPAPVPLDAGASPAAPPEPAAPAEPRGERPAAPPRSARIEARPAPDPKAKPRPALPERKPLKKPEPLPRPAPVVARPKAADPIADQPAGPTPDRRTRRGSLPRMQSANQVATPQPEPPRPEGTPVEVPPDRLAIRAPERRTTRGSLSPASHASETKPWEEAGTEKMESPAVHAVESPIPYETGEVLEVAVSPDPPLPAAEVSHAAPPPKASPPAVPSDPASDLDRALDVQIDLLEYSNVDVEVSPSSAPPPAAVPLPASVPDVEALASRILEARAQRPATPRDDRGSFPWPDASQAVEAYDGATSVDPAPRGARPPSDLFDIRGAPIDDEPVVVPQRAIPWAWVGLAVLALVVAGGGVTAYVYLRDAPPPVPSGDLEAASGSIEAPTGATVAPGPEPPPPDPEEDAPDAEGTSETVAVAEPPPRPNGEGAEQSPFGPGPDDPLEGSEEEFDLADLGVIAVAEEENPDGRRARHAYLERRLNEGNQARRRGEFDEASFRYCEVLGMEPGHPRATAGLARVAVDTGDAENAILLAQRLVRLRPTFASNYVFLGDTLLLGRNPAAARRAFEHAAELEPQWPVPQERLAALESGAATPPE